MREKLEHIVRVYMNYGPGSPLPEVLVKRLLEALAEPSEAMLDAVEMRFVSDKLKETFREMDRQRWQAMVRAAKEE